jgi:hypothetical protein
MTFWIIARYLFGTVAFVLGLAIVAALQPDYRVGLTLIGLALMYSGLDLLRLNVRQQAALRPALGYPPVAAQDAAQPEVAGDLRAR